MRDTIRRTIYRVQGEPITLAFVGCIADSHPEAIDTTPPTALCLLYPRHRRSAPVLVSNDCADLVGCAPK